MPTLQKVRGAKLSLTGLFGAFLSLAMLLPATQALALNYADVVPQGQVLGITTNTFYPYPSGSLINDSGTVYVISGTRKIPFTSAQAFVGLGYAWKNVIDGDLTNYTLSTSYILSTPNMEHPWGSWLISKGTVYYYTQDGLIGVPSQEVFTNNDGSWNLIVRANKYDLVHLNNSLPILTDNDNRVFNAANTSNNSQVPSGLSFGTPPANTNTNQQTNQNQTVATTTNQTTLLNPTTPQISVPAVTAGTATVFSATASDPNSLPLSYIFTWGDGSTPTTVSTNSATHTYSTAGSYSLMVTVTDTTGKTNSNSVTVSVGAAQQQTNQNQQQTNNNQTANSLVTFTSSGNVTTDLQNLSTQIQKVRQQQGKVLGAITGSFYTAGGGICLGRSIKNLAANDQCLTWLNGQWQKLGYAQAPIDQWGSPFLLDENETEYTNNPCFMDRVYSVGPDGIASVGAFDSDDVILNIPFYSNACQNPPTDAASQSRDNQRLADMTTIANALEQYKNKTGAYPSNDSSGVGTSCGGWENSGNDNNFIGVLVSSGILSSVPKDPINTANCSSADKQMDYSYAYYRFDAGSNGADPSQGAYYVLGIRRMETVFSKHPQSPGWQVPGRNFQTEFVWVTGKFEGAPGMQRDLQRQSDMQTIMNALDAYKTQFGKYPDGEAESGCSGWDTSSVGSFIPALVSSGIVSKVPVDPLNTGVCQAGYAYRYFHYGAGYGGADSAKGGYYVLGFNTSESVSGVNPHSPGFSTSQVNWQNEFSWVTGKYENP